MSLTQNRPPTRPAVGPNRSLVPRLLAALVLRLVVDWHGLCQSTANWCQLSLLAVAVMG